jgi:hypothetical protein
MPNRRLASRYRLTSPDPSPPAAGPVRTARARRRRPRLRRR